MREGRPGRVPCIAGHGGCASLLKRHTHARPSRRTIYIRLPRVRYSCPRADTVYGAFRSLEAMGGRLDGAERTAGAVGAVGPELALGAVAGLPPDL